MDSNNNQSRIHISSAISSIPLTLSSLPYRPNPTGSLGRFECLYTNHFICSFARNITLYQYNIIIEEINQYSNNWYEVKARSQYSHIMDLFISNNYFDSNIFVWYDEQKYLYSTTNLSTPQIIISNDNRNRLNIKSLNDQYSTNDIYNYINGQAEIYPYNTVRILEILLKKSLQNRIKIIYNKCYFVNKNSNKLAGDFEERHGFIQSLNLSSGYITLNIETKLTSFYPNISLIEFIHKQINSSNLPLDNDYKKLNRLLKNCLIVTQQSNWKKIYEFDKFDYRRPEEIYIKEGETLIEYYKNKENIILNHLNYPCIQVYSLDNFHNLCHLPLELCQIKEWQIYNKPLSKIEESQQSRKYIPEPNERYNSIIQTLKDCTYNSNLLCRAVDFHINDSEMIQFNGRVLTQPIIQTSSNYRTKVRIGRIPLDGHLFTPESISNLAITYFGTNFKQNKKFLERFIDYLISIMKSYNIYEGHESYHILPIYEKIDKYFQKMNKEIFQFVICIMEAENEDDLQELKANIKACSTMRHGIMTQCAILSRISNSKTLQSYCENLIRKINFKNAGINTKVDLKTALNKKQSPNDLFMFFGANVNHPINVSRQHPSIAALVGSGDSLCSTTAVRVCRQYPKEGKCSIETIIGMTEMVEQLLDYNQQVNGDLPTKIVFYRNGIDNRQFGKILAHEIPAIRQAFNNVYGEKCNHPLLTYIVIKKYHTTRFFTYNKLTNEINNMSIGSVIDTTIVHPYQNNFYLNSHKALHGVNRSSLYHIILDEIGFTNDELQLLTYHLCFTDPRSSSSEAIPSIVHQADIAALKARDLFYDDDSSTVMNIGGRSRPLKNPKLDDLNYKILNVHENLKDLPIFG